MAQKTFSFRVDEIVKKQAEELFGNIGISLSSAINMFLKQSVREQSIPFRPTVLTIEQKVAMLPELGFRNADNLYVLPVSEYSEEDNIYDEVYGKNQ